MPIKYLFLFCIFSITCSAEIYICKLTVPPTSSSDAEVIEMHRFERKDESFKHSLDYREYGDFEIFLENSKYILMNRAFNVVMIDKVRLTMGEFILNVPLNYQPSYGSCSKKGG
jgi:hypothetical protein